MTARLEDVPCLGCSLLCDDLVVEQEGESLRLIEPECPRAQRWLSAPTASQPRVDGEPTDWSAALDRAAALLRAARRPLLLGKLPGDLDAQRAALTLAEAAGATLCWGASPAGEPFAAATQRAGQSACTLGEIRARCDRLILLGEEILASHPRLLERVGASGRFVDRSARRIELFSPGGATPPDEVNAVHDTAGLEPLTLLREAGLLLAPGFAGNAVPEVHPASNALAESLRSAHYAVICWGPTLAAGPLGSARLEALCRLAMRNNGPRAIHLLPLLDEVDTLPEQMLMWRSAARGGIDLGCDPPRVEPATTIQDRVTTGWFDFVVSLGEQAALTPPPETRRVLLAASPAEARPSDIFLPVPAAGKQGSGAAGRCDEVAIPLRPLVSSKTPAAWETLSELGRRAFGH